MRKKYLSALLFGALLFASAGTFTSCKDYDDDINNLQSQIDANADAIKALQDLVNNGDYVTAVRKSDDGKGIVFTFSKSGDQTVTLDIENGQEGDVLSIDATTGELLLNGEPTGIKPAVDEEESLPPVKQENGFWVFLNEEGEYETTEIPVSGVTALKNEKDQWVLTVYTENGEQSITLPTAASLISEVEVLGTINPNENKATVSNAVDENVIPYNLTIVGDLTDAQKEWNKETGVKQLVKGQALSTLSSDNNNLLVRIAPATVDASEFAFTLINTQLSEAPLVLGTPVAYEGLLTRAENGLWMVPVSAKEGLTYKDKNAYIEQFDVNGAAADGEILFAFQEKEGFTSNYNLSFTYDKDVNLEAKVEKVNSTNVTGKTGSAQYTNTAVQTAANVAADVNVGTVTVSFDDANAVYDAHLHFDAATIERWGIEYTEGTSFTITAQPDDVTAANFQVQVHYVDMTGAVKSEWVILHVNKSYSDATEYANKDVLILGDNTKNTFEASLDAMFTDLGSNLNKWKADVESAVASYEMYDEDSKTWVSASNMTVSLDKSVPKEATKFTWKLTDNKTAMDLDAQYRAIIEFKDKDGEVLSKLVQPVTFSIPALTDLLQKEQVVFGGTSNGTGVMNEMDFAVETPTSGNEESLYSLKYAFVNQLVDAFANNTAITFGIDPNQTIKVDGVDTKMNTLAQVVNANTANVYVKLIDTEHAYNQPINMTVTGKYLGVYDYTDEEEAAAAFTIKLVSPIEQGTLTAKDGEDAIITVVATDNGTAKITESDLLAKTYAGIQYKVFKDQFGATGTTATGWSSPYIGEDPLFKSENENVFTMGTVVAAERDDEGNITEGYVVVKPMNVAYEDAVPVKVTVTDKWGYKKVVTINVQVKPSVTE